MWTLQRRVNPWLVTPRLGVRGYGVGQILYTWRDSASKFDPDFIFLYVFEKNYLRTISSNWCSRSFFGIDKLGAHKCLSIRPMAVIKEKAPGIVTRKESKNFVMDYLYIESNQLKEIKVSLKSENYPNAFLSLKNLPLNIYNPFEYEKFIEEQKKYIEKEMNGERMVKRDKESFLRDIFHSLIKRLKEKERSQISESETKEKNNKYKGDTDNFPSWVTTNLVNLRILSLVSNLVQRSGGQFTIIDAFQFHNEPISPLIYSSSLLEKLTSTEGAGYIPIYKTFNKTKTKDTH